ncbi:hypothetical protein [Hydrogeniiclostridium mannosilyticum]|uniref:hypothetical protein n=1 Tax=Hydrogeniiclostridium mannosilyticum TaxID=2764322 RepID=UPI00399AE61E
MNHKDIKQTAEQIRKELHEMVDEQVDAFLFRMECGETKSDLKFTSSLLIPTSYFKGKKPLSVIYPDGRQVAASTWKKVILELLKNCAADDVMHKRLSEISGKVFGRDRIILGETSKGMDSPIKIDDGIYMETKFDTESLLKVLTGRIFNAVGYDYSGIRLELYDPKLGIEMTQLTGEIKSESAEDEDEGFDMQMI